MFTQFFGNYLLNYNYVTPNQLSIALEEQKKVHMKLGVLAIHAGLMTAEQVDQLHRLQATQDKRIGDLAVEKGFVTREQVEQLFATQTTDYLQLGQALVDAGVMSNVELSDALADYKENYHLDSAINEFYQFEGSSNQQFYSEYVSLLFRNMVRFVGEDFTPLEATPLNRIPISYGSMQEITGDFHMNVAIEGSEEVLTIFAKRYTNLEFTSLDAFAEAALGEFLNVQNGLFSVNCSNKLDKELDLEPQKALSNTTLVANGEVFCIPIYFSFGTIQFIMGQFKSV